MQESIAAFKDFSADDASGQKPKPKTQPKKAAKKSSKPKEEPKAEPKEEASEKESRAVPAPQTSSGDVPCYRT